MSVCCVKSTRPLPVLIGCSSYVCAPCTHQLYDGYKVRVCNEAYTTKTCGRCGVVNNAVGGAAVFHCGACGLVADRDYHAARNIYLRAMPYVLAAW